MTLEVWEGWGGVAAIGVALLVAYAWIVVVLRVSGKRTLAKLNAFDFVVTIAIGSTLSSVIISRQVPLVEGLAALAGLVALQFVVALGTSRSGVVDRIVKSTPTALLVDGELRPEAMARCRIGRDEVAAAVRQAGISRFEDVSHVVFETDGTLSVLCDAPWGSALDGVRGARPEPGAERPS